MKTKKVSLKKNYIMNLSYQIVAIILPLVTTPYVSRVLHADGIGAYSYSLSVITYFSIFATLGVATYGQLEVAKYRDNAEKRTIVLVELFLARLCTSIICILLYISLKGLLGKYGNLYYIMLINLIACALDISWFFQGLELFKVTVTRNLVIRLISAAFIFLFVKKSSDLILYTIIIQGSTLVGNVALWPYLKKYCVKIDFKEIVFYKHWKQSMVFFIPTIATSVYTILDKSMIGWLTDSAFQNGYYEQAHKIEQLLVLAVTSLGTVTLPRMVYLFHDGKENEIKRIMDSTMNYILCISIPMSVGTYAIAPSLIPHFLGDGYEPCVELLRVFSVLIIIVGLDNTIGKQCLMATGRQKEFNIAVIVGAIVNLCVNLVLIPIFGAIGAAMGSICAEFVILSLFISLSKSLIDIRKLMVVFIEYLSAALSMGILVSIIGKLLGTTLISIFAQMFSGIFIYFGILILIRDKFVLGIIKNVFLRQKKRG